VDEEAIKRRSMEQVRAHLARADSELEAAHKLLDPHTDDEFGMDVVRAVANARTLVGDALETIRARF
jgi:cellobiose-specific phosphotransferase system component IIA